MIPAEIEIKIDKAVIREMAEKRINEEINEVLWFVDVDKLSKLTCMSVRWLEDVILNDVRMKAIERKKSRKRFYPAKEAFQIIDEITQNW